jgi:hypothetical protein
MRIIVVHPGDNLQQIVDDALDGTRLVLRPGRYDYPSVLGKNGMHFIGGPDVVFDVREGVQIGPNDFAFQYHTGLTEAVAVGDPSARAMVTSGRTRGIYFSDLTIDHRGGAGEISIAACNGVMWDRCRFINARYRGDFHLGHVNGNACPDNIYFRECEFAGGFRHPIYLDGVHGSVIIDCHITGPYEGSGFLFLCNNDFTHDYDGDGQIGPAEQRMSRFVVLSGVQSDVALDALVEVTGGPLLVEGCDAEALNLVYQARKSHESAVYDQRGVIVRNNIVRNGRTALTVQRRADISAGNASTLVGEYVVDDNTINIIDVP